MQFVQHRSAIQHSVAVVDSGEYMQESVLGPMLVDDVVADRSFVRGSCTIAPQLTHGCRMSDDGQE